MKASWPQPASSNPMHTKTSLIRATVEMLCIYEVSEGRILRASFATGEKAILRP
jgi:hypothetical protein